MSFVSLGLMLGVKVTILIDLFRLHVVWDEHSAEGARIAECISRHFDGLGMERDGVAFRVPVRFASTPWIAGEDTPRAIDLNRARHNAIILLHDEEMHDRRNEWDTWIADLHMHTRKRGGNDVYIAFGSPTGERPLPSDETARIQYAHRKKWISLPDDSTRVQRLLLLLLIRVRDHLRSLTGEVRKEPIFVSHAKVDGDSTARSIVNFINDSMDGLPLDTFYDASELMPGENYEERFKDEIGRGTLLAIVSDVYESRPWCVFELTEAKRARRPIILADICGGRISRTYPYGANLPRVRLKPESVDTAWIEALLVEAMSEGLRCDLFERQAKLASPADTLILPRPPELFDVVHRATLPKLIVYPDPPLGDIEADLIRQALAASSPNSKMLTLGEIT